MKRICCILWLFFILLVSAVYAIDDWTQQPLPPHPSAREAHAMAYIGDDKVLLFGGNDGSVDDETWVYDLSDNTWTQKNPSTKPPARMCHAMAYIGQYLTFGHQVLLFGGDASGYDDETWVYSLSLNTWTQKSPSPKPSVRSVHDMAYIDGQKVLLFGGLYGSRMNDTWVYDLSVGPEGTWTQKSPSNKPSARSDHAMALTVGDQVLLFGGYDGSRDDETWAYDLNMNTWIQKTPSKPSARYYHDMAYIGGDQVLLFGGWDNFYDNETWVYGLSFNTWTQKFPSSKPSALMAHAMAHIGGDKVLLFGGNDGSRDDETWVYDLSDNSWTNKNPSGNKPSARESHAMAYIGDDKVLLFGGSDGADDDETWVYDLSLNTWTQKNPSIPPSARCVHAMAYIGVDRVLLFGGDDGSYDDETWVYDLSDNTWTKMTPSSEPSARIYPDIAYIGGYQVLLFGGIDASGYDNETWVYDLSHITWSQDWNTSQPSGRYGHTLSETSMDGTSYLVLFGGNDGVAIKDDTWTFGGGDYSLPVELSIFTAQFLNNIPTLYWVTQSEIDNIGWYVYRNIKDDFEDANRISGFIDGYGTTTEPSYYIYNDTSENIIIGQTYWYWLESIDLGGESHYYNKTVNITIPDITQDPTYLEPPIVYRLQSIPNPTNSSTIITFTLNKSTFAEVSIYNILGKLVKTLPMVVTTEDDKSTVYWDGKDENGKVVKDGIYLYQLNVDGKPYKTNKLILLR